MKWNICSYTSVSHYVIQPASSSSRYLTTRYSQVSFFTRVFPKHIGLPCTHCCNITCSDNKTTILYIVDLRSLPKLNKSELLSKGVSLQQSVERFEVNVLRFVFKLVSVVLGVCGFSYNRKSGQSVQESDVDLDTYESVHSKELNYAYTSGSTLLVNITVNVGS